MLCKWNGDGLMGCPIIDPTRTNRGEEMAMFTPGWNEVADDKFNLMAPSFADYFADKRMELYGDKKTTNAEGKEVWVGIEFRDVRNDIARKIVNETFDFRLLKKWLDDPKVDRDLKYNIEKQREACLKGTGIEE
jgi:hypothetical protein